MQGTEKPDRGLLDALGLCGALVREGSVHRFLAEHRLRLFGPLRKRCFYVCQVLILGCWRRR